MDIKGRSDYFSIVHSLSGLFAFSALTGLHLATRICSLTLISKKQFDLLPYAKLSKKRTILSLRTYSGGVIIPKGVANLKVKYQGKMYDLRVLVVPGSGPNLFGRDWLEKLPINISAICNQIEWTNLNQEFAELFKPGLGTLKIATAKLYLKQK